MSSDALACLVALVGFPRRPSEKGHGILERCGLFLLDLPDPRRALHLLRREFRVDAIVINGRGAVWPRHHDVLTPLLSFAQGAPWDDRPVPVLFLTDKHVPTDIVRWCERSGVALLLSKRQTFRRVGAVVRQACHLEGDCCLTRLERPCVKQPG